jgi:rubredoxin
MRFFGETKIDFINKRRIAFIISALFIITGIVSLIINGGPKYSIDFTGGVSLELDLSPVTENAEVIDIQEIRDVLSQNNFVCDACGYIYNPAKNNNVAFDYLPEDWVCPVCGVGKDMFNPVDIKGAEIQEIRDLEGRTLILIKTKAVGDTKEKVSTQIVEIIKKNFPDNVNPDQSANCGCFAYNCGLFP